MTVTAVVYGSLGSVHPANFKTYTETLGLSRCVAKQLNRASSLSFIRASANVKFDLAASADRVAADPQESDLPGLMGHQSTLPL